MSNIDWSQMVTLEMKQAQELENLKKQVTQELQNRRLVADQAIAPLQDAADMLEATDEELSQLTLWKQYRILLSRVPKQVGYPTTITWPEVPDAN